VQFVNTPNGEVDNLKFIKGDLTSSYGRFDIPDGSGDTQFGVFDPDMNDWSSDQVMQPGSYPYHVILHELGHALGLEHPFGHEEGNFPGVVTTVNGDDVSTTVGDYNLNQTAYTMMSYNRGAAELEGISNEIGPMALDLAALYELYGVTTKPEVLNATAGNNTYVLGLASQLGTHQTLIDFGINDNDTIEIASGIESDAVIDLRAATLEAEPGGGGFLSYIKGTTRPLAFTIANGTVIENAKGAAGNDRIIGNSANNELTGNAGNDFIDGNLGFDTARYDNATTGIEIRFGISPDVTEFFDIFVKDGQGGEDTLRRVERVLGTQFQDTLTLDDRTLGILTDFNDIEIEIDLLEAGDKTDTLDLSRLTLDYTYSWNGNTATMIVGGTKLTIKGIDVYLDGGLQGSFTMGAIGKFDGGAGADVVIASAMAEKMYGGSDPVEILVASVDDAFWPLTQNESKDTISYELSTDGVTINLSSNTVSGGFAEGDQIDGFENAKGSIHNDEIIGDSGDNELVGLAGDDRFTGGGGNDVIQGGIGADTVVFSGDWKDYLIVWDADHFNIEHKNGGGDGTDTIFDVEMFQFADVTLRWDEIANKAPTSIKFAQGYSQITEDPLGRQPYARLVANLESDDPNNTNADGITIDRHSYTMAAASLPYYGISGNEVYKQAINYINYETWRPMMQSLHASLIGSAMSFEDWLEDIKDGISSINHAAVIAQLADMYKFTVTSTDLHGASLSQTFIVSYANVSGLYVGDDGVNIISGTPEEDLLYGMGGDDIFLGNYGYDQMFGGDGIDTVSYATFMQPSIQYRVVVNLASGGTEGDALGDTYNSIENVIGSKLGDILIGDVNNNEISGGGGNDNISGEGGDDKLIGGQGNDVISGGSGIDTAYYSGEWRQYTFSKSGKLVVTVTDTVAGRDGVDTVDRTVEFFHFADVTLSSAEIYNRLPSASMALNPFLQEDVSGNTPSEKLVGILSIADGNNVNGIVIDPVGAILASESSAYYSLTGDELHKNADFELDYEAWYLNLKAAWTSKLQTQGGTFEDWLESIKASGISPSMHSEIVAMIDPRFKVAVNFWDSHGTHQTTFIVSVGDIEGLIVGDGGDNDLVGTSEEDVIQGLGGDDRLEGYLGPDVLDGGDGSDTASYEHAPSAVTVNLKTGATSGVHAVGDTYISIENLEGSAYADTLIGDDGDNVIAPGDGKDTSDGGAGIDTIDYSKFTKQVTIDLQLGDVREYGVSYVEKAYNFENAIGTKYNDTLYGTTGNNVFEGRGGNDTFHGRGGADRFDGGDGFDLVSWNYAGATFIKVNLSTNEHEGDAADDILIDIEGIEGTVGNDTMIAGDIGVVFRGLDGDDHLYGGAGANTLDGGTGNDHIYPGIGADFIQDSDLVTIDYSSATTGIQILWNNYNDRFEGHSSIAEGDRFYDTWLGYMTLIGSDFDDDLMGRPHRSGTILFNSIFGDETIYGGGGNDTIKVQTGNNIAYGGTGDDTILADPLRGPATGSDGVNRLYGEEGNDTITGGAAADFLYGGSGWDWIDPGTDAEADLVDLGEDGGGLKFTAKGSASNGYGAIVDLSTMTVSENRLGSAPVANLWSNDNIVGEATGVWGTALNDIVTGSDKAEKFLSGGGYDVIHAGAGDDYIKIDGSGIFWGEGGEDFIEINSGSATVYGGDDDDLIYGGRDSDTLFGDAGDDIIYAYNPVQGMASETASDTNHLYGGTGADKMYGGNGKDYFHSLDDGDLISGYGNDVVFFDEATHGVVFDQGTGQTGYGTKLSGFFELHGTGLADEFTMTSGGKFVYGEGGEDIFHGGGTFYGGADNDVAYADQIGIMNLTFFGGGGNDVLWGGNGYDGFHMDGGDDIYISSSDHAKNYIWDFDAGAGTADKIVLDDAYLYKNGSLMSFSEFISTKCSYDGYNHYTSMYLGDTTILFYGQDYRGMFHPDDFIFV